MEKLKTPMKFNKTLSHNHEHSIKCSEVTSPHSVPASKDCLGFLWCVISLPVATAVATPYNPFLIFRKATSKRHQGSKE